MAFTGLFKTPAQIKDEENQAAFKGTTSWGSVGVGLGRMFSGESAAQQRAAELDAAGDELIKLYNSNTETGSWDDVSYTNQLALGEQYLRKKGYSTEANTLFDERVKRRTFERAELEEKRKAAKALADSFKKPKATGTVPTSEAFKEVIPDVGEWMTSVDGVKGDFGWADGQKETITKAFGELQRLKLEPGIINTIMSESVAPADAVGLLNFGSDLVFSVDRFKELLQKYSNIIPVTEQNTGVTSLDKTPASKPVPK
jgi:hypothetical protein